MSRFRRLKVRRLDDSWNILVEPSRQKHSAQLFLGLHFLNLNYETTALLVLFYEFYNSS